MSRDLQAPPHDDGTLGPLARGGLDRERLRANLTEVYGRIEAARGRGPHAAAAVTLCIVTKAAPAGAYDALRALGERDVGENRVMDAVRRREGAPVGLTWHGIGHLQTNKAKRALEAFDVFHALDRRPLAEVLEPLLAAAGRTWPVFVQVNAARDPKKSGVAPEDTLAFLRDLAAFPHLEVLGLMAMPKEEDTGERARPTFALLRGLRDDAVRAGIGRRPPHALSLGMSEDFAVAVEEGSTLVRVGRAIWEGVAPPTPLDHGSSPATVSPEAS